MRKTLALTIGMILALAVSALPAQNSDAAITAAIQRVTFEGRAELSRALSDPQVGTLQKEEAIKRLAHLTLYLDEHKEVAPSELFNPILGALSLKGKKYEMTRKVACQALTSFADLDGSDKLIGPLGRVAANADESFVVRRAAASALGRFRKNGEQAAAELTRVLSVELDTGPKGNNISFTTTVVHALGRLRNKKSFVPLMRVMDSAFPTETKMAAQKGLENIDWERKEEKKGGR